MKRLFAYIRVSTKRQGEGVSLKEQRAAIEQYAQRSCLSIASWFEEQETAAKRGRAVFSRMLAELRDGKAAGVIIHKIDRSARNLRDWADLGELIDAGVEVHFASESLDLASRGGRLSADIQAVVAADYIRNLREETRKGFYGRLKQGVYPLPAPPGYLDCGRGKPKEPHPVQGELIRTAFQLYDSGEYGLHALLSEMDRRGLRTSRDRKFSVSGIARVLRNPFYMGVIRLRKTGERFPGAHRPLVTKALFERVGARLDGRMPHKIRRHAFLFRRVFACQACGRNLIGERQKGHHYYRCHSQTCRGICFREEQLADAIRARLCELSLSPEMNRELAARASALLPHAGEKHAEALKALLLREEAIAGRLERLTDALVDGVLDQAAYRGRRERLELERIEVTKQRETIAKHNPEQTVALLSTFLDHCQTLADAYETGSLDRKRELVLTVFSNRCAGHSSIDLEPQIPYRYLLVSKEAAEEVPTAKGPGSNPGLSPFYGSAEPMMSVFPVGLSMAFPRGAPYRGTNRTFVSEQGEAKTRSLVELAERLLDYFTTHQGSADLPSEL